MWIARSSRQPTNTKLATTNTEPTGPTTDATTTIPTGVTQPTYTSYAMMATDQTATTTPTPTPTPTSTRPPKLADMFHVGHSVKLRGPQSIFPKVPSEHTHIFSA